MPYDLNPALHQSGQCYSTDLEFVHWGEEAFDGVYDFFPGRLRDWHRHQIPTLNHTPRSESDQPSRGHQTIELYRHPCHVWRGDLAL